MAKDGVLVPLIDLANFPAELEKLAAAITDVGFFQVTNHGITAAHMAQMKETALSLFQKPTQIKNRNVIPNLVDGNYRPRNFEPKAKYFESFSIYDAASPPDVHSFCSVLQLSPEQREIISVYFRKLHGIIMEIASKVAETLGLPAGFSFEEWSCQGRVMSYKFTCEEDIGCVAAPVHTDSSFMTILQADQCAGGLQIMDDKGNFVDVHPLPGAFFVNMGDMAKVWSNERLQTVKHRVICKKITTRISIALFLLAPKDGYMETEPTFIDAHHPKLYQRFIYNDYRRQRNQCGSKTSDQVLPFFKERLRPTI